MKNFFFLNSIKYFASIFLIYLITSCSSDKIINLRVAKDIVKEYYESGQYDKELENIYINAKKKLNKIKIKSNSIAVFDIDDTALSNYQISKRLDYGYDHEIIQNWVMSGKLPGIKQTKEFYTYLKSKGVRIVFLTGRHLDEYEVTYRNLIEQGYTEFDTLIVRNQHEKSLPAAIFKLDKRSQLVKQGYDIILTVGDQWSDLEGNHTGIKVKLPNYLYIIE